MALSDFFKGPNKPPVPSTVQEQFKAGGLIDANMGDLEQRLMATLPSQDAFERALSENPDLNAEQAKAKRRDAVIERMAKDAKDTEDKVIGVTQSWLRLTKGFSPRALAEALAHDPAALDNLRLALMLAPAYEPNQETSRDSTAP